MAEGSRRRHLGSRSAYAATAADADRAAALIRDLIARVGATATDDPGQPD
jgi:hypothetical protein